MTKQEILELPEGELGRYIQDRLTGETCDPPLDPRYDEDPVLFLADLFRGAEKEPDFRTRMESVVFNLIEEWTARWNGGTDDGDIDYLIRLTILAEIAETSDPLHSNSLLRLASRVEKVRSANLSVEGLTTALLRILCALAFNGTNQKLSAEWWRKYWNAEGAPEFHAVAFSGMGRARAESILDELETAGIRATKEGQTPFPLMDAFHGLLQDVERGFQHRILRRIEALENEGLQKVLADALTEACEDLGLTAENKVVFAIKSGMPESKSWKRRRELPERIAVAPIAMTG